MGGYQADEAYNSQADFFKKYFFGYHLNRLEAYDQFLRRRLQRAHEVFSIGSGRCANELFLLEDGYQITCSDINTWGAYEKTKALFPRFTHRQCDILAGPLPRPYDAIVSLSLIYLFDERELRMFFNNVSKSLHIGGHLILDSAGSPDNVLAYLIHEKLLKYETVLLQLAKGIVNGRRDGWIKKHHGYRRTDREITEFARHCGLELRYQENYGFTIEFKRSRLLDKLITRHSSMERMFGWIGRSVPYIRMYDFEKVSP